MADDSSISLLLELAASDDLPAFLRAVEDGTDPTAAAPWYSRSLDRSMGLHSRTPLHIAALYGSTDVLNYLLSTTPANATLPSASDSATPLHLAAAGGAPSSPAAVSLLLSASADVDALDAAGHRPADLIPRLFAPKSLDLLLKSTTSASPARSPSPPTMKKDREFPPDLTLPDIKNGIYGTDEFRMYTFKVKPCSRAYSHDWTDCPFVHPGENARRRDPRKYVYSSIPCPEFRKGACRNGDNCEYAHGVFESWLHPQQYRTRLCKDETGCNRRVCFFAHRHDELRSVNQAAVPSSPRMSSLDMATALLMMQQQQQQQPGSPRSPSAPSSPAAWMNQAGSGAVSSPTMQLPSSRLKTALAARDMELDLELMGLEGYQQKLISEISSPRSNLRPNGFVSPAASRASEYSDLLGSLDHTMMSQLQGLTMKQTATAAAQYQSSTGMIRGQPMSQQQLLSGYGGALQASSMLGLEHSTAKAIMNARSAAFAKRSQSFIDHGAAGRNTSGFAPMANPDGGMSGWGSPGGKLDWGVQGEELNKLRKSASFATRSNGLGGRSGSPEQARTFDEPDLSWVHSLVKDGPAAPMGQPQQRKQYHQHNGGRDYLAATEMLAPWVEQEQMVA